MSSRLLCLFSCIKWEDGQDKQMDGFTLTPYYATAAASDSFLA